MPPSLLLSAALRCASRFRREGKEKSDEECFFFFFPRRCKLKHSHSFQSSNPEHGESFFFPCAFGRTCNYPPSFVLACFSFRRVITDASRSSIIGSARGCAVRGKERRKRLNAFDGSHLSSLAFFWFLMGITSLSPFVPLNF